jgi:AAA+ superfamily predicted ATPase
MVRGNGMKASPHRISQEPELGFAESLSPWPAAPVQDRFLEAAVRRIRLRGHRRVLWQRHLWRQTAQHPAQGLAIPHEEIDIVCGDLDNRDAEAAFYRTEPAARKLTEEINALETTRQEAGEDGRLEETAALFALSALETDFLILCIAPELDPRLRRLYGYLHDDAAFCAPTPWLAQTLFEWDCSIRLTASSALVHWLLAYPGPGEEQPWSNMARWMPDPRLVGHLCGHGDPAPSLQIARQRIEMAEMAYAPSAATLLRQVFEDVHHPIANQGPRFAQLVGAEGIGRKTWAGRICAERGLKLLCLDAPRLLAFGGKDATRAVDSGVRERLVRAEREALLQPCVLYWDHADAVPSETWTEAPFQAPFQLFGVEQPMRLPAHAPFADIIAFPLPTPAQAQALWQQVLPQGKKDFAGTALAERFTLTPAEIKTVAPRASHGREALWAACRSLSHGRLGKLATLLPCPFTWEDIVLPADTAAHLREIAAQTAHRITVYERWGFGKKRPLGRGVSALFAGPSGTGKTMAAQVLAAEMGVVLFRIDLASVVSKYIGETEKNLRQIFDEAERLNAVIFFDEADALFGKRTEVKDAHDRYANIEINYLLQRMEAYEGLAILATNRKGDLDPAFLRRLRFIVDFPMPGIEERKAIWRLALPERAINGTSLLYEINWDMLAARLEISGAGIKDISLGAAFLACGEETKIGMNHLLAAARREMAKHGRLVKHNDFGSSGDI